jgi:LacI family transcriptional regulator
VVKSGKRMKRQRTRKGAPGIVEVAQRARVSTATVSRFYNTPDVVRAPTRKRIEQAAIDLGYIRDRMAGTLHNRFSGTIGLIVPTIDNAIFAELIQAFSSRLHQHDRTMLIAMHGYELSMEVSIVRSLLERRIDGVGLIGFQHDNAPLEMLASRNVPVLVMWNYRENANLPCVGADNFNAGYLVTSHLIEQGHYDIGLLFPSTSANDRADDRLKGALRALKLADIAFSNDRLTRTPYDIGEAKRIVTGLLGDNPPSALVCGNDIIAQGAIYACQALGYIIPDDISIIGIGDFRGSAHMEPSLTTLRMPARRIGELAADYLCESSDRGAGMSGFKVLVPTELKERGSVKSTNG